MKSLNYFRLTALLALAWPLTPWAATDQSKGPPAKVQLRTDDSPVNDGKSGLITSYADVVEPVQKAVVTISSSRTVRVPANPLLRQLFGDQIPDQERKEEGLGSGVIVSSNGYILTNNHVVEGADELSVELADDRKFTAKVIGTDEKTDVAVVKIDAADLPSVTLADSDKLRVGDIVFAVGNPLAVGETVTMGIVSAKGRNKLGLLDENSYENYIQTDAAINMGNSGGALVDAKGRLVGINSAILSPSRGNVGIGFAIPVNLAAIVMKSLVATGTVTRGYIGLKAQTIDSDVAVQMGLPKDAKGVIVTEVTAGSPADKAGLKEADAVLAINNHPVNSTEDLRLTIAEMAPGSDVTLQVVRDSKPITVKVKLTIQADKPNDLFEGVTATPLTDDLRRKLDITGRVSGLVITAVDENSPYAEQLAPNMVIMEINRTAATDLASARELVRPGHRNLLLVYFRGQAGYSVINVK